MRTDAECRGILDSIEEYIISFDRDWNILFVSKKTVDDFGLVQSDLIGKNFWKLFPNFIGTELEKNYRICMEKRETRKFEWKTIYVKESIREFTASPSIHGITVYGKDITKRKKAEEALKESEKRLKVITESTVDPIYIKDCESRFIMANPACERAIGKSLAEMKGKSDLEIYSNPAIGRAILQTDKRIMNLGITESVEEVIDTPYGQRIFLSTKTPWRNNKGEVIGIIGISRDITERKKDEDNLRENEERFRLVAEAAKVMVYEIQLGKDEVKIFSGEEVLGYGKGEIPASNKWWFSQIHREDCMRVELESAQVWETGHDALLEYRIKRQQGDYIVVHDTIKAVKDEYGRVVRVIGGVRDVTKRMENEKALQRSHELLKQKASEVKEYANNMENLANERLRQLKEAERLAAIGATAGMVGHDIRNPLQAIVSDLYLLKDNLKQMPECGTKNEVTESLDSIDKNITYINKIVADLQDYAKTLTPEYSSVNLKCVVQEIINTVGIPDNVKVNDETAYIEFRTDPTFIRRALTNLVTNAVQAMPNGGSLTIRSCKQTEESKLVLTVEDTGVGIPDKVKPKVFMPMMTTKSKGQGLGLAVVKRLVEALHGTISFESQEGKGTKFIVTLPTS